jgi:Flp pilus assembly protein TadD
MFLQEEAEHVMGSMSTQGCKAVSTIPNVTALPPDVSKCTLRALVSALVLLATLGCASHGPHDLRPRTSDEAALRQEADGSTSAEPLYQLALLYLGEHRVDEAVISLQSALSRNHDYEPALTLLAKTLHQAGRSFEALEYFEGRPLDHWSPAVQINIALLQADVGNTIEARQILQAHLGGEWKDSARANLAYLDLLDEETVAARKQLEELIDAHIDSPEVLNNLAVARLRDGDVQGSVEILQRLTSRHEEFAVAHINLALLLQHWLFDDEGATRTQDHLDTLLEPMLSDAVILRLLDPAHVENTAPPVPTPNPTGSDEEDRP